MSYARFGEGGSDVYLFSHVGGYVNCCGCSLVDDARLTSSGEVLRHLREHVYAGDHVPLYLFSPEYIRYYKEDSGEA